MKARHAENPKYAFKHGILCEEYWRRRALQSERLLRHVFTRQEIGRAHHIADLEEKNKALKEQVTQMRLDAEFKNRYLQATELIVNCTGCDGGFKAGLKWEDDSVVKDVEHIAKRLRAWWEVHAWRKAKAATDQKGGGDG